MQHSLYTKFAPDKNNLRELNMFTSSTLSCTLHGLLRFHIYKKMPKATMCSVPCERDATKQNTNRIFPLIIILLYIRNNIHEK